MAGSADFKDIPNSKRILQRCGFVERLKIIYILRRFCKMCIRDRQYTSHIVYEAKIVYEFTTGGNHERNLTRKER